MIARLFIFIYDRTSFTFTIAVFTTTWSWVASFYGFYFVYATVNFRTDELIYLFTVLVACTGVAIFFHLTHFGMFHRLGFSGFTESIRNINRNLHEKFIFTNYRIIDDATMESVYSSLASLPRNNLLTAFFYTVIVISSLVVIIYIYSRELEKVFFIILGGMFASLIIGYCTFLLTEYFIGPYKMRIEQILFDRSIKVGAKKLLGFRIKSVFMLLMILFSMIILTILIWKSEKPIFQISIFIFISIINVGLLIFLMINNLNLSLDTINRSTKKLAAGESGLFFPPFSDKEFILFSNNYNLAAIEINEIRSDLERKITERTEELSTAYEKLNNAYGQIQADLSLAKRIQKRIMPDNFNEIQGLDLSVHYFPMADIGGDIYDIFQIRPGLVRIFLADAIGHGIQAALITMIIKGEYEKVKGIENLSVLLKTLNESFIDLYMTLNAFFSCILLDIDITNKIVRYSSAGHPDQILITDSTIEILKHTGKLIGVKRDTGYDLVEKKITIHDKILLYTDGLFEQYNQRDEVFGEDEVVTLVDENKNATVSELHALLISSLKNFMGGGEEISVCDDITLIGIEIKN